jgi:hypothetical protein
MKTLITLLLFFITSLTIASPRISFKDLLAAAEEQPKIQQFARAEAMRLGLPVNIITSNRVMFDAKGMEDGKVVYAVMTNFLDVYDGAYTAFYEEAAAQFNFSAARIDYGNGNITDNTGGLFNPVVSSRSGLTRFAMIPGWSRDKVYLFSAVNGDIVDTNFIPQSSSQLASPRHAIQHHSGNFILVADQINDIVHKFNINGTYVNFYAPSTGPNTAQINNVRGIRYRANNNLLVTSADNPAPNQVAQFDTAGNYIGAFITANITSPFDILLRSGDMLISCSSGSDIVRFDLNGVFLSVFSNSTDISFAQQMLRIPGGRIAVSSFSTPNSGLAILDSSGTFINRLTAVTGNRGVFLLENGHYLVTNAAGLHEIDSATGGLIRTIFTTGDLQYISEYTADLTGVVNGNNTPLQYSLMQNYPNPFNPVTNIKFSIPKPGFVTLKIYDMLGREAAQLVNKYLSAGIYNYDFDASHLASGIYFYSMKSSEYSNTKRMILIK